MRVGGISGGMSNPVVRQRIWPLFLIATIVMVLGSWLAVAPPTRVLATRPVDDQLPMPPERELTPIESVRLTRGVAPVALRVTLLQQRQSAGNTVRTQIKLLVQDSAATVDGDITTFYRSFDDVTVTMESDGSSFAAALAGDVERLVETARQRLRLKSTGEIVDVTLVSAEAAQLRQMLDVIGQLTSVAHPRLPRDAVRAGETWRWSQPFTTASGLQASTAKGNTEFAAEVVGETDRGAVIRMEITGTSEIEATNDQAVVNAQIQGTGEGIVIWDVARGRIAAGDVIWRTTSHVGDEAVHSTARVHVESE